MSASYVRSESHEVKEKGKRKKGKENSVGFLREIYDSLMDESYDGKLKMPPVDLQNFKTLEVPVKINQQVTRLLRKKY